MGVYANTISMIQFKVTGDMPPSSELFDWGSEKLSSCSFRSIENSTEELAEGWTNIDKPDEPLFEAASDFWRDNYLCFSLRRDQRKIPSALLKSHAGREEGKYLAQNPNMRRAPRNKREEIKEQVRSNLLSRCLPVPSAVDVVWDISSGVLTLFTLGTKVIERFEEIFRKSFPGLSLVVIHPFARARRVLSGELLDLLEAANQAGSDAAAAMIRDNQWLGTDFMLWLLHSGMNLERDYSICTAGHLQQNERFDAWIDERIQLEGGGEEGRVQRVAVSGSQDSYQEAVSALKAGKRITSAKICLEKDDNLWKLTLKGDTFGFASFSSPQVRLEKDATVDMMSEREALFYERMFILGQGLQMFESLYTLFLQERLTPVWDMRMAEIKSWLAGEKE